MAGCSADLGRFDFASSGPGEGVRSAGPVPAEPVRRGVGLGGSTAEPYAPGRPYEAPPVSGGEPPIRMSGLPDSSAGADAPRGPARTPPPAAQQKRSATATGGRQVPTAAGPVPPSAAMPPPASETSPAAGETIEVQPGDTLYGIAKRHRVSISELMKLNNLEKPDLRPGRKLVLPAGKRAVAARPAATRTAAQAPATPSAAPASLSTSPLPPRAAPVATAPAAPPPGDWTGSHTVAQGESLYAIARRHSVRSADLQAANGIADPTKLRPGAVLKVPAGAGVAAAPAAAPMPPAAAAPAASPTTARIINAAPAAAPPTRLAALPGAAQPDAPGAAPPAGPAAPRTAAAEPPAAPAATDTPKLAGTGKFRWPVKGKVIAGFGPRPDGTHNDGINVSVPQGTDVAAAEAGVVAYAGNELKGYGNLVLIRHENNWVSAYAHNEALLVKRGDKVKRGQIIAKAGNTGTVDQPQVHFELRQGSKPVDPMPFMEKQ